MLIFDKILIINGCIRKHPKEISPNLTNTFAENNFDIYPALKEYINIRMVSIIETSEHAAKNYLSTLAVLQLDSILVGAKKTSIQKTKPDSKNQKSFERIIIMEYEMAFIGKVKMTVGIRRRTREKIQYCITAIRNA